MILSDNHIKALCTGSDAMITPFRADQVRRGEGNVPAISYGLSSYGYDITLSDVGLRLFRHRLPSGQLPTMQSVIDPKAFNEDVAGFLHVRYGQDANGLHYLLPPRAYALGVSVETFNIPDNVLGICYCKSTYARCGLMVNTTPLEPEWRGQLVIELANLTDMSIKVYANEGIAQVVFFSGTVPSTTYADRSGKYQDQKGIQTAKI